MSPGARGWSRRGLLAALGGGAVVAAAPGLARAAGHVSLSTTLGRPTTEVGEAVELIIEVSRQDGGDGLPEPILPDFRAMGIAIEGPRTGYNQRTSWVNGRRSSSVTQSYVYFLIPSRPGRFEIAVTASAGGTTVRPPAIPTLEVTGAAASAEPVAAEAGARPQEAQGDVFVWATVDKAQLFVGEQLTYDLEVYERVRFQNIHLRELPGFQDFWSEELPERTMRNEVVGGVAYRVHPGLRRALFPQRAGTLTITAAQVGVGLRRRVSGQALGVEVLPLPAEGQPPGFSPNNVGSFTIEASVDRKAVKVGEPFTLTVIVRGEGNIRAIDTGTWPELPGMRRYDPKVETQVVIGERFGGLRRHEFLVIPEVAGEVTIPAHAFAHFDPARAAYEVARSEALTITVTEAPGSAGAPPGSAAPAAAPTPASAGGDDLLASIQAPPSLPRASAPERWLSHERWVTGMIGAPAVAAAGWLVAALVRRHGGDSASRERAARAARQRALIKEAEAGVSSGEGFHAAVAQVLQGLALERAGAEGEGQPRRGLLELLRRRGCDPVEVTLLGELLDRCDAARFGAAGESAGDRREVLEKALRLVRGSSLARGKGDG